MNYIPAHLLLTTCSRCMYWSDKQAHFDSEKGLRAKCLNENSPEYGEYLLGYDECDPQDAGQPIDE